MLCECCRINKPVVKDYRGVDFGGFIDIQKYLVCTLCFNLADDYFFKLFEAKDDKERKEIIKDILINIFGIMHMTFEEFNKFYDDEVFKKEIFNWLNFLDKKDKDEILSKIKENDKKLYLMFLRM